MLSPTKMQFVCPFKKKKKPTVNIHCISNKKTMP